MNSNHLKGRGARKADSSALGQRNHVVMLKEGMQFFSDASEPHNSGV